MHALLLRIIAEPWRFSRHDLPCALQTVWEMALEDWQCSPQGRQGKQTPSRALFLS